MSKNNRKLKYMRRSMGLSQAKLAETLGVDPSTISRWENGSLSPSGKNRKAILSLFDNDTCTASNTKSEEFYNLEEEKVKALAKNFTAISRSFDKGKCYSISEKHEGHGTCNPSEFIFRYERKDGIHHCFREIHGNWTRTYTDAQLVGKIVKEVKE